MLMRLDPFRELDRLASTTFGRQSSSVLAMDAYRHGDEFVVHFDVPGAAADSIDLSVEKNVLTVKATRSWNRAEGDEVIQRCDHLLRAGEHGREAERAVVHSLRQHRLHLFKLCRRGAIE